MSFLAGRAPRGSQVIKQADVVMLVHLLWSQMAPAARAANFAYYEPRCGHGSSLSASIHALVGARLGDTATALGYLHQAAEIDLANNMGNASGGVHAAALGGLWQTIVFGFAGLTMMPDGLAFHPNCPNEWKALDFPVTWRGRQLQVHVTPEALELRLTRGAPMQVCMDAHPLRALQMSASARWERQAGQWQPCAG